MRLNVIFVCKRHSRGLVELLIESHLASIESTNGTDRKLKCSMYLTGVRAFAYSQSFTPLAHQSPYIHLELQSERVGVIDWMIHSHQTRLHFIYFLSSITYRLSSVFPMAPLTLDDIIRNSMLLLDSISSIYYRHRHSILLKLSIQVNL